jgi:hypothetical protein
MTDFDSAEFIATTIWTDTRVYQAVRRTPKSIWIVPTVDDGKFENHGEYSHIPLRPMTEAEMAQADLKPQRIGRRSDGSFSIYKGRKFYVAPVGADGRPYRRHDNQF